MAEQQGLNTTEEIIEDIRQGKMVIVMDDEDRENEGDLLMAAESVRPEDINFMATHGRGLICLTLTREHCKKLQLPLMVQDNYSQYSTNFTVSIEAAEGVTTGISAADRAVTVQAAVKPDAVASDIVQPGHIFPLSAQPGGVLSRAGHTEAGCDLARLAGRTPAAVIVEILNEDGTMARRPDLEIFAKKHGLKIGTIADLIHYRNRHEQTIERQPTRKMETRWGDFDLIPYRDSIDDHVHFALVKGQLDPEKAVPVRVHVPEVIEDLLGGERVNGGWPLQEAIRYVGEQGEGVVVVLGKQESADELMEKVAQLDLAAKPHDANNKKIQGYKTVGAGSQILADLGVHRMKLLSAPKKFSALSGFDLQIEEYIAYEGSSDK
ncbi:bifunctional 3,4-dihydroxy-2-butanone-4-phosphate synthase/GTP cyclohydrolase II [Pelagibaculum spongiae]|uniref:3,4-dihydroxy-2-butanone 4-phosphate synthase n=1 Tax=Pelagibaculum spongiae TaxID=2080658 RepID=A0A2V1H1Z0_9GAMM|nr:bifunctional 3,4-dihydroxy-2-butanone-4-phosphate synthase/GTP cyclohydrolase II [Pelagibaculum spongiae]PVZ72553.1 3,4-dihydroxy-2-butanone-4-phosphate synthase [Pelagibaculum spongiae]